MLDWWLDLPRWLKVGVALLVLGISTGFWMAGTFWPWGWGVGTVLLFAAFMTD